MAFTIDGIVIDRIQMGIAEKTDGTPLYVLTQLTDATINVTAESKEAKDANGTLIKTFYTGKTGKFTANNAILDFNLMAEASGTPKQVASGSSKIVMPGVKTVKVGETSVELKGAKEGTVRVIGVSGSGSLVKNYTKDTDASETAFSITGTTLKLPTDTTPVEFVVKYEREVESGMGEAVKYAFLDKSFSAEDLTGDIENLVFKCVEIKNKIVQKDEFEKRPLSGRKLLNLGHTVGHALEAEKNYELSHGLCVAYGIKRIIDLSADFYGFGEEKRREMKDLLRSFPFDFDVGEIDYKSLRNRILSDKKIEGDYIKFVLIKDIGDVRVERLPLTAVWKYVR